MKKKPPHYWDDAKKFLSKKDKKLAKIISKYDGHLVTRGDPFYSLCRSIIGQQISVKAADSVWLKFGKIVKKNYSKKCFKTTKKTIGFCWFIASKNFVSENYSERIF